MADERIEIFDDWQATAAAMTGARIKPLDAALLARHQPTRHLAVFRHGAAVGRCSVWTQGTPTLNGRPVGIIGHYVAEDADAAAALLGAAERFIADADLPVAVGPMDGNTWNSYRFVTDRGAEPPFFLEPDTPPEGPHQFAASGFVPLARYFSSLNDDLSVEDPRSAAAWARFEAAGVRLRTIDLSRYTDELLAVHALSVAAFADNFLYTPISATAFVDLYAPLRAMIRPELVLLAEQHGELIGFMFGVPDMLEARRGEPVRTAIAKSMAVRPGRAGAGLGSVLMDRFQQAARHAGFGRVIHALMHENNRSLTVSGRYARPIRQYSLYQKVLSL